MEENMEHKPERHTKRRFRWGRLIVLLTAFVLLAGAVFKGTVFIYETFIDPSHGSVHVTAANDAITVSYTHLTLPTKA